MLFLALASNILSLHIKMCPFIGKVCPIVGHSCPFMGAKVGGKRTKVGIDFRFRLLYNITKLEICRKMLTFPKLYSIIKTEHTFVMRKGN